MLTSSLRYSVVLLRKLGVLIWSLAYLITLFGVYRGFIAPFYNYMGFVYYPPTTGEVFLAVLLTIIPAFFVPYRLISLSGYLYTLTYYLVYVPTILVSVVRYPGFNAEFLALYLSLLLAMLILGFFVYLPTIRVPHLRFKRLSWNFAILVFTLLVYTALIAKFGLRPPPSPLNPYDVRLAARELGPLTGYLLRIAGNVLAPAVLVMGLCSRPPRRVLLLGAGLALFVLVYSFDGTKSTLFSPLLIIALWYIYRRRPPMTRLLGLGVFLIWMGVFADLLLGKLVFTSIGVRRAVLIPGLLTNYYYDFFVIKRNPLYFYSHSFMKGIFQNVYDTSPSFLIGKLYFSSDITSANANFLADAIANLGVLGVPLLAVLTGSYVYLMRSLARGREELALLMASVPLFALMNSSFFTTLLTHGLFLATLVIWFFPGSCFQALHVRKRL